MESSNSFLSLNLDFSCVFSLGTFNLICSYFKICPFVIFLSCFGFRSESVCIYFNYLEKGPYSHVLLSFSLMFNGYSRYFLLSNDD